jgi:hypothetical protein
MRTRLLAARSPLSEQRHGPTRREVLSLIAKGALASSILGPNVFGIGPGVQPAGQQAFPAEWELTDASLLEEIVSRAVLFFWNEASPRTGLVRDRALADGGPDPRRMASIAATGYGLAALCVAHQHRYIPSREIYVRVIETLNFLLNHAEQINGFFYHFLDIETGRRVGRCEVSPIDTAILLCGVLTARAYFQHPEIQQLASTIYRRMNWRWMLNGGTTFAKCWTPENQFAADRWDTYSELMMMYLLAVAAPLYNISPSSWDALGRPVRELDGGHTYISSDDPLFVHQYSQAWFDFRGRRDKYADYFENSATATYAHKQFCRKLTQRFPDYDDQTWGISASDSSRGYRVWGGLSDTGQFDGTVVPGATAGSIPFLPKDTISCLKNLYLKYGLQVWKRYGFVNAFNPLTGWIDPDVIGIDTGISMMMAENYRSGFIWQTFMRNPEAQRAMQLVGFQPSVQAVAIS